jgi:hypothetical protein
MEVKHRLKETAADSGTSLAGLMKGTYGHTTTRIHSRDQDEMVQNISVRLKSRRNAHLMLPRFACSSQP